MALQMTQFQCNVDPNTRQQINIFAYVIHHR